MSDDTEDGRTRRTLGRRSPSEGDDLHDLYLSGRAVIKFDGNGEEPYYIVNGYKYPVRDERRDGWPAGW